MGIFITLSRFVNHAKIMKTKTLIIFKAFCMATIFFSIMLATFTVKADTPPFLLSNDPAHETSTWIHSGNGYINQLTHPDILYFPNGWGNVDGEGFKYWMAVTGYEFENDKYEQPCILVSNSLSSDNWEEPSGNLYNTNPLPGIERVWPFDESERNGYFSDVDIVYNDDTDEIWAYFRTVDYNYMGDGREWIEIYKTSDGITWEMIADHIFESPDGAWLLSPSVIKEGNDWWMWIVRASVFTPNHILFSHSTDGVNWSEFIDLGYNFRTSPDRDPWHIDVVKYNDEYWGFLVESALNRFGGDGTTLTLIKSPDKISWSGYDNPILESSIGSWDSNRIYRGSFVIENGYLEGIYSAKGSDGSWHAGYTSYDDVGGAGWSSNVIIQDAITVLSPSGGEGLYAGETHTITWVTEGTINFINIEYSINNGADWVQLVEHTENDGSHTWVVPCDLSTDSLIRITETDGIASDTSDGVFSITDNLPPSLTVIVTPDILWPPNHKMINITPEVIASDNCTAAPTILLTSITMNEGDETNSFEPSYDANIGDGNTLNDIEVEENGKIYLRAERSGTGMGRIYSITYSAIDAAGNIASASTEVNVPHNK